MSDLNAAFEAAVANSKLLTERPDNPTLLKIYALYKQ
ncbi:MAG TPA: acyl-CoA-binding protein, partial [Alicycliphilus denitrificans]|nr:acyl-CoA-binding protein [Alicycliphilus denitrificans]